MIGHFLWGTLALVIGLIAYGSSWLRFLWRGGRRPRAYDIGDRGPALLGGAMALIVMLAFAVGLYYGIAAGVADLLHFLFGVTLWPH